MKKITITALTGTVVAPSIVVGDGVNYSSFAALTATLFKGLTTDKEKVLKLWHWMGWKNMQRAPRPNPDTHDPILLLGTQQSGWCNYHNHDIMRKLLGQYGIRARWIPGGDAGNPTSFEAFWDGAWHYLNSYNESYPIDPISGEIHPYAYYQSNPNIFVLQSIQDEFGQLGNGQSLPSYGYLVANGKHPSGGGEFIKGSETFANLEYTLSQGESKVKTWPSYADLTSKGKESWGFDPPPTLPELYLGNNTIKYSDKSSGSRQVKVKYEWTEVYDDGTSTKRPQWAIQELRSVSNLNILYPRSAVDSRNNIHMVWQETESGLNGASKVYYGKLNLSTKKLTDIVQVSTNGVYSARPDICIDDNNGIHIVFMGNIKESGLYTRCISEVGLNDIYYSDSNDGVKFNSPITLTSDEWWHFMLYPRVLESGGRIYAFWLGPRNKGKLAGVNQSSLYDDSMREWRRVSTDGTWGSSTVDTITYSATESANIINYSKDEKDNIYRTCQYGGNAASVEVNVSSPAISGKIEVAPYWINGDLADPMGAATAVSSATNKLYLVYSGHPLGYDNGIYFKRLSGSSQDPKHALLSDDNMNDREIEALYPQIVVTNDEVVYTGYLC
jgi:hypothetical protein